MPPSGDEPNADPGNGSAAGGSGRGGGGGSLASAGMGAGRTPAAALSSSALLARLRARNQQALAAGHEPSDGRAGAAGSAGPSSSADAGPSSGPDDLADLLAARIVSYLQSQNGSARTNDILAAFRQDVGAERMPLFKQLLKQLATLRKRADGGVWVLKREFAAEAAPGDAEASEAGPSRGAAGAPRSSRFNEFDDLE